MPRRRRCSPASRPAGITAAESSRDAAALERTGEDNHARQADRGSTTSSAAAGPGRPATSLYQALSGERSPDFDTVLRVMAALGLRLHAEAAQG
jgi:DNA-binding phage protein